MNRAAGLLSGSFRLSINPEILRDGKEDSYERNPGGVSFVFNHKLSEPVGSESLQQLVEKIFSTS